MYVDWPHGGIDLNNPPGDEDFDGLHHGVGTNSVWPI